MLSILPGASVRSSCLVLAMAAGVAPGAWAESVESRGSVAEVTVYRGQALVTREVKVPAGAAGLVELVVTDLPERIVPTTIFAESKAGVEVRSVRYRVRPVMEDVNEQVRALDAKIRELDDKLGASKRHSELLAEHRAYLAKLEGFVAPAATVELSKGVLNAETLKALTELLKTQRATMADEELNLVLQQRSIAEQRDQVQRERAQITSGSSKSMREAVLLVNVPKGGAGGALAVRYLVDQAGWTPSYTIRADGKKDHVLVEYYAAIQQMSGEDWGDVAMTLSTATPSLVCRGPELRAMTVSLGGAEVQAQAAAPASYAMQKGDFARKRQEMDQARNTRLGGQSGAGGGKGFEDADKSLNTIACDEQLLDLLSKDRVVRTTAVEGTTREGNLSVTYALGSRTSLPSRADRQQVQIASISMPAEFYKMATPVLTEFVYDEAQAANTSTMVLLAGPAATYVEGRFVGSGEVPTVSVGEKFAVGLGIDSSLRASRELVEKSESVQGGNRVVDLVYRLGIENFGETEAKVRLLDRLPKARESEVKLTLTDPGLPLSTADAQNQKKNGILRWDVGAPGHASGEKAWTMEYKFRLEHDKQMTLAGMGR